MYGAKVKVALACGVLLIAGALARPAAAIEWNLTGSSGGTSQLSFDAAGTATDDIKVRGYFTSNADGSGAFDTGYVAMWSGGVGIYASDDSGSPNHAIDNKGRDNFLLIEFDDPNYALTAFRIGWMDTDSDVEVWIGGGDLGPGFSLEGSGGDCAATGGSACEYTDLGALGFAKVGVFQNVVVNSWTAVNSDVTGRYVIIAGEFGEWNDFFKLSGIKGEAVEVPEPSAMLLFGAGLAGLGLLRRFRRR